MSEPNSPILTLSTLSNTGSLENLLNSCRVGLSIIDPNMLIIDVNDAWCDILEYSKEQLLNRSITEISHPNDVQKTIDFVRRKIQGEKLYQISKRYLTGQQREIWCELRVEPIFENGELQCFMLMLEDITDIKQNEFSLENTQLQLQSIADKLPARIAYIDRDMCYQFVNEAYEEYHNFSRKEILGKKVSTVMSADIWIKVKPRVEAALAGEKVSMSGFARFDDPSGNIEIIKVEPDFNQEGDVKGALILVTQVKDLKDVESYLEIASSQVRSSEENLRKMMESTPDSVVVADENGIILFINSQVSTLFGYSASELIGAEVEKLLPELFHEQHRKHRSNFLSSSRVRQLNIGQNLVGQCKGGAHIPIDVGLSSTQYDNKPAVLATIRDATIIRKALQSSHELEVIIEASGDGVFRTGLDGNIQFWNKGAEKLYGYKASEIIGSSVDVLLQPEVIEKTDIREAALKSEATINPDAIRIHKDGHLVNVSLAIFPIKNSQGAVIATASVHRDIGDVKHLEEQLRHAQRMETAGQIAGGIAHDFNNILTVIQGSSTLIGQSLPEDSFLMTYLNAIDRASQRAGGLTRQLLSFSRKQRIDTKLINPSELIEELSRILGSSLGEGISLETNLLSTWLIQEDPAQFEQVIMNLSMNAKHAMSNGGTIIVETSDVQINEERLDYYSKLTGFSAQPLATGAYVQLCISDNGTGIDRDVLDHIFEPFYTTKSKDEGTGLGLSVVYGVVTQNGGSIFVETKKGKGTRFFVLMPMVLGEAEDVTLETMSLTTAADSETILLVEDDLDVLNLTTAILESAGYQVIAKSDPIEALKTNFDQKIDLILSDIVMPGMNGLEFSKKWLEKYPNDHFLFMSGYAEDTVLPLSFSPEKLIQKPFKVDELLSRVSLALMTDT